MQLYNLIQYTRYIPYNDTFVIMFNKNNIVYNIYVYKRNKNYNNINKLILTKTNLTLIFLKLYYL